MTATTTNKRSRIVTGAAGVRRAAALLRAGSVCAFPTETVYGLGANALSPDAVAKIYRLKQRPSWNPLIVHVASVDQARTLAEAWPDDAEALATAHWPGPLTLVVKRRGDVPAPGPAGLDTIAIRVPAHPTALALLRQTDLPLAAPSANRSEHLSPTTARHVIRSLPEVPLVLDGGPCRLGIESTVLDLASGRPRLLRPGALPLRAIRDVVGDVDVPHLTARPGVTAHSPGMSPRHYAPKARVIIRDALEVGEMATWAQPVGALLYTDQGLGSAAQHVELLPDDPGGYAADLYAALHRLDDAEVATIVVQSPPPGEDWLGVRDRLRRAAA